ncbi:MAG: endonuclease V [Thermoplasmataceae archaeon]
MNFGDADEIDLYGYLYTLLLQIPKGSVTTYGSLATALGDIVASRAVGTMLSENSEPDVYPCYKVVYSNGKVGNYTHPLGVSEKYRRLNNDGISIKNGIITDFESVLFKSFVTDSPLEFLKRYQEKLQEKISLEDNFLDGSIGAVDVSYEGRTGYGVFVWKDGSKIFKREIVLESNFPYIPGYLSFREFKFIRELCKNFRGVLMVDGNGLLHPRKMGLATYAGIRLNIPTIGVAKSLQTGKINGNDIYLKEELTGKMVSKNCIVSSGQHISLLSAEKIVKSNSRNGYPEILKIAHNATVLLRKKTRRLSS